MNGMTSRTLAQRLHLQGTTLREQDKHQEAMAVLSQALLLAIAEKDLTTATGVLGDRALVWKHQFLLTHVSECVRCAEADTKLMMMFAQDKRVKNYVAKSYFLMGEITMLKKEYTQAIEWYQKAIDAMADTAEKGDFVYHLGEALYRAGKKQDGLAAFKIGLTLLMDHEAEVDSFLFHVWLSGLNLRLAELLSVDDPEKAKQILAQAKDIIDADERLIIRKRQYEVLVTRLKSEEGSIL